MREVVEPLALVPGVRIAAMVSQDGVPITVISGGPGRAPLVQEDDETEGEEQAQAQAPGQDVESLAVVAAGWLGDVTRAVAALAWNAPHRLVMRGGLGTIVIHQGPGAIAVAILERGTAPEEVRVPMEGAIARMQRLLRGMGRHAASCRDAQSPAPEAHAPGAGEQPPGIFPGPADPNVGGPNAFVPHAPNETRGND